MSTADVVDISERINESLYGPIVAEPGVRERLDFIEYARIDAASQSRLNRLMPPWTPAHCLAYMQQPPKKTEALIIGDATHCAILEPERFEKDFIPAIEGDGRTAAVKAARERQAFDFPSATIIKAAEYETTLRVRDAVWEHPAARVLLKMMQDPELSIIWRDGATGEMCKGRLDAVVPAENLIIDLKSTRNASRDAFARSISQYGYHRQGAFYQDGANATLGTMHNFPDFRYHVFIAFEKVAPYAVAVYRLSDNSLKSGRAELAPLLALYSKCRTEDNWPAYSEDIEDIDVAPAFDAAYLEALS